MLRLTFWSKLCLFFLGGIPLAQAQINAYKQQQEIAARESHPPFAPQVSNGRANNINVLHQTLRLKLNPAQRRVAGSVTTRFSWTVTDRTMLYFDLSSSLTVDSVVYHNRRTVAPDLTEANLVKITLPTGPKPNYDSVRVYYKGVPPQTGFGSIVQSSHNGSPILWTLSEPYGAKDWWPCKQDLVDKIDSLDMIVEVPNGNKVGSNGLLKSVTSNTPGFTTYHWQERYPITCYLVSFAITNYEEYTYKFKLRADSLLYQNYLYPESNNAFVRQEIDRIIPIMRVFDSLFGPYPFVREKYGHAQFGWGGGQEHQTMSSMVNFDIGLQAHELAHQWFGDKITLGTWKDIWLNEGFATYCEGLSRLYTGRLSDWESWKTETITGITSQPDGSVMVTDTADEGRIFDGRLSYAKGAFLLHNLRWLVGDSAFFAGVRNYATDPTLAYGYARTADFIRHMEAASRRSLGEYFSDYYAGQGHPIYTINYSQPPGAAMVNIVVNQRSSHTSVPFFENKIELYLNYSGGRRDTLVLNHTANAQVFSFPTQGVIQSMVFDPNKWVLGTGRTIRGITSLDEMHVSGLRLVPNPAYNQLSIEGLPMPNKEANVQLFDATGKRIKKGVTKGGSFDVSNVAPGVYELRVIQGSYDETVRLSIER